MAKRLRLLFPRWVLVRFAHSRAFIYSILGFSRLVARTLDRFFCLCLCLFSFLHRRLEVIGRDMPTSFDDLSGCVSRPGVSPKRHTVPMNKAEVHARPIHSISRALICLHHSSTQNNTTVNPPTGIRLVEQACRSLHLPMNAASGISDLVGFSELPASDTIGCMSYFVTWYYNVRMQ